MAYMNAPFYSKILDIMKYLRDIRFSMIFSGFYINVILPEPNTMTITHYHLSWGHFKNIAEKRISIGAQYGFWIYNSHFYEMSLLWTILTIHTIDTLPKTQMPKKSFELTLKKINVCTAKWNHFFIMGEPHRPSFLVGL